MVRIELFTDMDADNVLDAGEGMQDVLVVVSDYANSFSYRGYSRNGVVFAPITVPAERLEIAVPYLGETQQISSTDSDSVQFAVTAPLLPIQFP